MNDKLKVVTKATAGDMKNCIKLGYIKDWKTLDSITQKAITKGFIAGRLYCSGMYNQLALEEVLDKYTDYIIEYVNDQLK